MGGQPPQPGTRLGERGRCRRLIEGNSRHTTGTGSQTRRVLLRPVAGRLHRGAASLLDKGDEMTKTAQDIIAGVEVLTIVTECYGGGGSGGTDKRGETKMTVLVGESGAMSIMDAIHAAGFVIVSNDALKAGSDGYG